MRRIHCLFKRLILSSDAVDAMEKEIQVLKARCNGNREQPRFPILSLQWLLPLFLLCSLVPSTSPATSIQKMDTDQLIAGSELVIDARVTAIQVRPAGPRALPYTYATLEIIEIIKGEYAKPAIELGFLGGTLDGRTLGITEMHPPQIGERGIYFVESLSRQQVHAFYGWDQGHYVLQADDSSGEYRVYTRALQPVTDMEQKEIEMRGLSKGYAADLKVEPEAGGAVALPVEQFKTGLRQKVRELQ